MQQQPPPFQPQLQQQRPRRKGLHGCLIAFIISASVTGAVIIGLVLIASIGSSGANYSKGVDEHPDMQAVWSYGSGDKQVARIGVRGPIMRDMRSTPFGPAYGSAELVMRQIRAAKNNPDIDGIILELDSPGGGITASDMIYEELMSFKRKKPGAVVVALMEDLAASGAYYVAMPADHIIAHPTTLTGSIGVMISTFNIKELAQKVGVTNVTFASGENKGMLSPFEDMTPEQNRLIQEVVDEMHTRFVQLVAESRQLPEEEVRKIADGRVFTSSKAIEYGLVDEQGYWDDAVKKTAQLLGVQKVKVMRYEQEFSLTSLLTSMQQVDMTLSSLLHGNQPQMMYIWKP